MTNTRLIASATTQLLSTLDSTAAKLPKNLRTDIDTRLENASTIGSYQLKEQSIAEAMHDAITEGRDPLADPNVQRAALASSLTASQASGQLSEAAHRRLADVIDANLDTIITAVKGPFDAAGKQLTAAHATLKAAGLTGLDDPGIMQSRSIDIVTASAEGRVASDTLNRLDNALNVLLGALQTHSVTGSAATALRFDMGDESLTALSGVRKLAYWDALDRGYTISLATSDEQAARIQRAEQTDRTREQAARLAEDAARKSRDLRPVALR